MPKVQNNNAADIVENWDHPISPAEADNLRALLEVVTTENRRIDIELNAIYENRFLGTASGKDLEKLAELVGVQRKTEEEDKKLRKRIRGAFAAHASDTTYDEFTAAALSILGAKPETVNFITPPETQPKTVELQLDGAVLDSNPLTKSELVVLLNGAISADAQAKITTTGTFGFDGDDVSLEGFNEGSWSVGIN